MYSLDHYKISLRTKFTFLFGKRKYIRHFSAFDTAFRSRKGLEIGGPSRLFSSVYLPVYQWAETIDGCNFSSTTLWEGNIQKEEYDYYPGKKGHQYILDGTNLHRIADSTYDFVLSCHNLEHIANPLLALREWLRVLKPGGYILMVLPDKRFTFDRRRPYTTIEHLVADLEAGILESDLTHLTEILQMHDLSLDSYAGKNFEAFKKRSQENITYRGLHHHVYSPALLRQMLDYYDVKTIDQYFISPFHQTIIGCKA